MGRLFYLFGKSASGKDSLYQALIADPDLYLKPGIIYTTRPMRVGEEDGVTYHFVTYEKFIQMQSEGMVLESRTYQTIQGPWTYFTADDGQLSDEGADILMVGTLQSYRDIRACIGTRAVPLYIEVEDDIRLMRAIERERQQVNPDYCELCRRFLADAEDFSLDRLKAAGIKEHFLNHDFNSCVQELKDCIFRQQHHKSTVRITTGKG